MTEALVDWQPDAGSRPGLMLASSIAGREAVVNQIRRGTVLGVLRPDEKLTEVALATTTITVVVEGPAHHRAALRLVRWRPSGSKLSDASHARNASRTRGQSASTIAYQAVSRLRPLITTACRKIPS